MREWDCGSFDSDDGRFWNRVTIREALGGFQVWLVSYDRGAGMRKTETILAVYPDLETARAQAWQISRERR